MAAQGSRSWIPIFIFIVIFFFLPTHQQHHPLDPLSPSELNQVRTILKASFSNPNFTFQYVGLDEPDKPAVLSWLSGHTTQNPPRRAFVLARSNRRTHQIVVDLSENSVVSDQVYRGHGYPMLTVEEQNAANALAMKYPPFVSSIKKRGLKIEEVVCESFTVGWYGEKKRSSRVVRVQCYCLDGTVNFWMRPIEGITVTVDLDTMTIVDYNDRLMIPVPKAEGTDYRASKQKPPFGPRLKPITVLQPEGPTFTIDGNTVK